VTTTLELIDYTDPRAIDLRHQMDTEMGARYAMNAAPADELAAINRALAVKTSDVVGTVLAVTDDGTPVAHAALRRLELDGRTEFEVKRVIVAASQRGTGLGVAIMNELERIAVASGAHRLILQTGDKQPEAVGLYLKLGYTPIPAYEPYASVIPFSLCYEKTLN
jgi:GNAT superfamily N-acetyltransferase